MYVYTHILRPLFHLCHAQREAAHNVTRGLREHMLDSHKTLRAPRKINLENVKNGFYQGWGHFFAEFYTVLRLPGSKKRAPRASKTRPSPRAVEMHMDISQGNWCAKIYRKMAGDQIEHPDLTPAFGSHLSVWTLCLNKW